MIKDKIVIEEVDSSNYNHTYENFEKEIEWKMAYERLSLIHEACMTDFIKHKQAQETGKWVLEDVDMKDSRPENNQTPTTTTGKISNATGKAVRWLIENLEKLIRFFGDQVTKLRGNCDQWLKDNAALFDTIPDAFWNDCTIKVYPYAKTNTTLFSSDPTTTLMAKNYDDSIAIKIAQAPNDDEKNKIALNPNLLSDGNKKSITEMAKWYYRGINLSPNLNTDDKDKLMISCTGSQAKQQCALMKDFVSKYKEITDPITASLNKLDADLKNTENELNKVNTATGESYVGENDPRLYSILENCSVLKSRDLQDTLLVTSDDRMVTVTEDGEATASTATTPAANQTGSGATGADPNANQTAGQQQADQAKQAENNTEKQKLSGKIYFMKLQIKLNEARMSIVEECFNSYMKTLMSVVNNAKTRNQTAAPQQPQGTVPPATPAQPAQPAQPAANQ